jgi:UDP-N-acetyl-D-mannosaminuronate dehydrogenase
LALTEKKNKPYSAKPFAPSRFKPVDYQKTGFAPSGFAPSLFTGAQFVPSSTTAQTLLGRINIKDAPTAVIGLGHRGLELLLALAEAGYTSIGFDPDTQLLEQLTRGESPVGEVSSEQLAATLTRGKLTFAPDWSALWAVECFFVCPQFLPIESSEQEAQYISQVFPALFALLRPGVLVALDGLQRPGSVVESWAEAAREQLGAEVGARLFLASRQPARQSLEQEQEEPGDLRGVSQTCVELAGALYSAISRIGPPGPKEH